MSKARLLAHCSAAVRPRADIKARAINLVLELSGRQEADDVAALLEDREGARALMRATKGDPEDVTKERIPYIMEAVKLAAGEFAAQVARQESDAHLAQVQSAHDEEVRRLEGQAEAARQAHSAHAQASKLELVQKQEDQQALAAQNKILQRNLEYTAIAEKDRRDRILQDGLEAGAYLYKSLRWLAAVLFGVASGAVAFLANSRPDLAVGFSVLLGFVGFWFVPDLLDRPLTAIALKRLRSFVADRDPVISLPSSTPDFRRGTWHH